MAEGLSRGDNDLTDIHAFPGNVSPNISSVALCSEPLSGQLYEDEGQQNTIARTRDRTSYASIDSGTHDQVEDLDLLDTHCKCPCGQTSFQHCINPPPDCLVRRYASPQGFAEMDVTQGKDSEKAKMAMRLHFRAQTESLKETFTKYAMEVYYCARAINGVVFPLKNLFRFRYPERVSTTDMSNFEVIYEALTKDVDFLNFDLLGDILKACNNVAGNEHSHKQRSAQAKKEQYEKAFYKFAQLRIFSAVGSLRKLLPPIQEGEYPKLKIKVEENFEAFVIDRAEKFRDKIRGILHLPSAEKVCLRLTDIEQGCVEITFELIGKIDDKVFEMDASKKRALASNNISLLEYAGKVYYCCCNFFSSDLEASIGIIKNLYSGEKQCHKLEQPSHREDHSPDCPSIKEKKLICPLEQCVYCEAKLQYCFLEFHTMECDKRIHPSPINTPCENSVPQKKVQRDVKKPGPETFSVKKRLSVQKPFNVDKSAVVTTTNHECCQLQDTQYKDGLAFQFDLSRQDLSLKAVSISQEGIPSLHFTAAANKVPTITEEDVATCIQLSLDHKRPELFYNRHLSSTLCFKPPSLRHTSIGELFVEVFWNMKCLNVNIDMIKDYNRQKKMSRQSGVLQLEKFSIGNQTNSRLLMTCQSIEVSKIDHNKLAFVAEPKMDIESSSYGSHIDEKPCFLKMKEIVKLMVAVEWLRDKGVQFSEEWIKQYTDKPSRIPSHVLLPYEERLFILRQLQAAIDTALERLPPLFDVSPTDDVFHPSLALTAANENAYTSGVEFQLDTIYIDSTLANLCIPVCIKVVARIAIDDYDFLFGPVTPDEAGTATCLIDFLAQLMPFLYGKKKDIDKTFQDGCTLSTISVEEVAFSTTAATGTQQVKASKSRKAKKISMQKCPSSNKACPEQALKGLVQVQQLIEGMEVREPVILCLHLRNK